jgi:hypothetical protein
MNVTTHFHLVLRLRMYEAIPPLLHMSSWCGAALSRGFVPYTSTLTLEPSVASDMSTY